MYDNEKIVKQFLITPAAGKRVIALSIKHLPQMKEALQNKTVLILAGTTNGYVAEEVLSHVGQLADFSRERFFRGITFPPKYKIPQTQKASEDTFMGDVVIEKGQWVKGKTVFDVVDGLQKGDIIFKGANALNIEHSQGAIYIGHPKGGTISAIMEAVIGRRVSLYLPVGLEKRVPGDLHKIAQLLNAQNASGPRMMPVPGETITELDAIRIITGAEAQLIAGGGVCGAEGSCWVAIVGTTEQMVIAENLMKSIQEEPKFRL